MDARRADRGDAAPARAPVAAGEARTRVKNEIHAILIRRLKGRPDVSDLFGRAGRARLGELVLAIEERDALNWPQARRLMTVPGVTVIAAATFLAAVGNIERFPERAQAGRLPRPGPEGPPVRGRARHARPYLQARLGRGPGRVGASQLRAPSASQARCAPSIAASAPARGHQVAITATAPKLAGLFWVLLWRQQDYAFGQPTLTAKKIRRLEITAGAPRWQDRKGVWIAHRLLREAELDLARQAEHGYAQTVRDRQAAGAIKAGASVTPGRASQRPSEGKAARQTTSP